MQQKLKIIKEFQTPVSWNKEQCRVTQHSKNCLTQSGRSTHGRIVKPCLLQPCIPNIVIILTLWFSPPQVPPFPSALQHCLSSHHAAFSSTPSPPFSLGVPREKVWRGWMHTCPQEPHGLAAGCGTQGSHRLNVTPRPCIFWAFVIFTYLTYSTEIKQDMAAWEWECGWLTCSHTVIFSALENQIREGFWKRISSPNISSTLNSAFLNSMLLTKPCESLKGLTFHLKVPSRVGTLHPSQPWVW